MNRALWIALLGFVLFGSSISGAAAGTGSESDIIGGEPATISQWPWQVGVADPPNGVDDGFQRQFCGGTLVSATAVLTAAHCVVDTAGNFEQPSAFSLITGRSKLSDSGSGSEIAATDVIYFVSAGGRPVPQSVSRPPAGPRLYNDSTSQWDVAIIGLASPAPAPASPIAIASPAERGLWDPGDTVYATGWGTTFSGLPSYSDDLRQVELKVISDADCGDAASYDTGFDPATMVCAGNPPAGGKDTCQGDSGGPLVAPAGDGTFRLIGDTSFGEGCAVPEKWGVSGRVADATMRPAIEEGIAMVTDAPVTPPPEVDRTAPTIKLGKHPKGKTRKRKAKFTFTASETATFTCALDKGTAKPCTSPFAKRVQPGRHRFAVIATDAAGNSSTAAGYRWKVAKG